MANFCSYNRDQTFFTIVDPDTVRDINPLVKAIDDFVERHVSLEAFSEKYKNDQGGAPAKHPRIMLKVLFYSYSRGVYSSHMIENHLSGGDLAFTYLSSNKNIDHSTICKFILKHSKEIQDIFTLMVYVLNKLGLVKLNFLAVDGTKVQASAGERFTGTIEDFEKKRRKIEKKIKKILDTTISEELGEKYKKRIVNKLKQLQRDKDKIDNFFSELEKQDKPPKADKRINLTDSDSVMVKDKKSRYMGYNCQAAVDDAHHCIAEAGVFNEENEKGLLEPMISRMRQRTKNDLGKSELGFDAGYFSSENIQYIYGEGLNAFIPEGRGEDGTRKRTEKTITSKDCTFEIDGNIRRLICPGGQLLERSIATLNKGDFYYQFSPRKSECKKCKYFQLCYANIKNKKRFVVKKEYFETYELRKQMTNKLRSPKGKLRSNDRSCTVEHVFGDIKEHYNFRRFLHRNLPKVELVWTLVCMAYNFRKIAKITKGCVCWT